MEVEKTNIKGLLIIHPEIFGDDRGFFLESYNKIDFEKNGVNVDFVQDNFSQSSENVLRGLHYQVEPYAQGKLVSVINGAVLDVVVDIRKDSETYGKHFKYELSNECRTMLWIPPGLAHGFLTLQNKTLFFYKCTNFYHKESERAILWNDPELAIEWGIQNPIISEKDSKACFFKNI
ncbi:MAG: dTDP-4-dehydrorhamnose 3,5-epimerase [Bacteroidales bacterium]|nr:dTDP-4-dehydrorhamnose 3,5-epimerase [Bacteroidales bacterium]